MQASQETVLIFNGFNPKIDGHVSMVLMIIITIARIPIIARIIVIIIIITMTTMMMTIIIMKLIFFNNDTSMGQRKILSLRPESNPIGLPDTGWGL